MATVKDDVIDTAFVGDWEIESFKCDMPNKIGLTITVKDNYGDEKVIDVIVDKDTGTISAMQVL